MSDFIDRHISDRLGDFAGRRRHLDQSDALWIMARKRRGLSDQAIATQGRYGLADVQKITSEHALDCLPASRPTYDPQAQGRIVQLQPARVSIGSGLPLYRATFGGRLVIQPSLARAIIARMPPPRKPWHAFVREVAIKHGLTLADLIGPYRAPKVAHARQEAMWVLFQERRWSYPQIGRFFGGRDHTTIMHGVRRHQSRLDEAAAGAAPPLRLVRAA